MLKFDQEQLKFDLVRAVKLDFLSSEETGFRHFLKEALSMIWCKATMSERTRVASRQLRAPRCQSSTRSRRSR